jgi:RNA polymerase sigma factor FliA
MNAASETIQETWDQFLQTHDEENRNALILHYLPLVKYAADRLHARLPSSVSRDDLIHAGIVAMIRTLDRFNPGRGVLFETYCSRRVQGAMVDYLRQTDWTPRLVRDCSRRLEKTQQTLLSLQGRMPTEEEMAADLQLDMQTFRRFRRNANAISLVSLQSHCGDADDEEGFQQISVLQDTKSRDPFLEIQKKDVKEYATRGLSREEKLIITLYYFEGMTMREIGTTLGISESRVCQIHSSVIARLKARLDGSTFQDLFETG